MRGPGHSLYHYFRAQSPMLSADAPMFMAPLATMEPAIKPVEDVWTKMGEHLDRSRAYYILWACSVVGMLSSALYRRG